MAHDYIDIGGSHIRLDDFHICALRHLLVHCASEATAETLNTDEETLNRLREFLNGWTWLGPGVFTGTDFDTFATSRSRIDALRSLFDRTCTYVAAFGSEIPLAYLQAHVNTKSAYFTASQSTSIYREILTRLTDLLLGGSPGHPGP